MIFSLFFTAILAFGAPNLQGRDLMGHSQLNVTPGPKGTVVVFMSAICPCSNSHVEAVKKLSKDFGADFNFVVVHSNADEDVGIAREYFKVAAFGFPIIEDEKSKLADQFKANKTPHAFLVAPDGRILYKGGVTNSKLSNNADREFLREALLDVQSGHAVKTAEGRTLGCIISRGEKFVW